MSTNSEAMFSRVDNEIKEGKFYESMQHILTLVKRNALRKQYNESMETLYKYALVYLDKDQYVLAGEMMDEYCKVGESGSLKLTPQMVTNLLTVFETPWKKSSNSAAFKQSKEWPSTMALFTKFINRAILWSKSQEFPNGNPTLHRSLGEFYKYDKQYNKAQANLVYAQDVELLFQLVKEWKEDSKGNENIYLRAVLTLLAARDPYNAKSFVYMLDYDFDDSKTPDAVKFAYLLTESCDPPNMELFCELCETYKGVLERDSESANLVSTVKESYFKDNLNFQMGNQQGVENTLSGLIRAFM